MRGSKSLTVYKVLLITLITSLSITGLSFLDDKIWNLVMAIVGVVAYAIVGGLYSIPQFLGNRKELCCSIHYSFAFRILCISRYYQIQQWILSWPLALKIILPSMMVLLIAGTIIWLVIKSKKERRIHE